MRYQEQFFAWSQAGQPGTKKDASLSGNPKFQTKRRPLGLFFKTKNKCNHFSVPGMLFNRGFPGHGLKILAKKTSYPFRPDKTIHFPDSLTYLEIGNFININENPFILKENPIGLMENPRKLNENPFDLMRIPVKFKKNPVNQIENPFDFMRIPVKFKGNPINLIENLFDLMENPVISTGNFLQNDRKYHRMIGRFA